MIFPTWHSNDNKASYREHNTLQTRQQTRPILFYERLIEQYNLTPHGVVNSQLLIWALD